MTIEAIAVLKSFSENPLCSDKHIQAFNIAIDTMHKYQQIEEIYKNWRSNKCEYTISCMESIGKVLKND